MLGSSWRLGERRVQWHLHLFLACSVLPRMSRSTWGVLEAIAQFVVLMLLSRVGQLRVLLKAALLHLPEDKCAECV